MNMTDEQIDTAIAALQAMKATKKPREWWGLIDRDGDLHSRLKHSRADAEDLHRRVDPNGTYAPYTLIHIREVMEGE